MSSARALTGGTRDVNPQFLSFAAAQSGADTTTTVTQAIPIQRLPIGGRSQVMEVLKVYLEFASMPAIASATETTDSQQIYLSTASFGTTATNFQEPRVFAGFFRNQRGAFTAAGTYGYVANNSVVIDLTDGSGHGFLVATDNIFAQVISANTGATQTVAVKLLYRWKNVGLGEYIGIVQGQQ